MKMNWPPGNHIQKIVIRASLPQMLHKHLFQIPTRKYISRCSTMYRLSLLNPLHSTFIGSYLKHDAIMKVLNAPYLNLFGDEPSAQATAFPVGVTKGFLRPVLRLHHSTVHASSKSD